MSCEWAAVSSPRITSHLLLDSENNRRVAGSDGVEMRCISKYNIAAQLAQT